MKMQLGLSSIEIAEKLDTPLCDILSFENGNKPIDTAFKYKFENIFNCKIPEYNENIQTFVTIPYYEYVTPSAGTGIEIFDGIVPIEIPVSIKLFPNINKDSVILRVSGDSMSPRINDGDKVVVNHTTEIYNNNIYVLCLENELFIKLIKQESSVLRLISYNSKHAPITVSDTANIRIIGQVVGLYSTFSKQ